MAENFAPGSFDLAYDGLTGTRQQMHFTTDNKIVLETTVEIDEIAERNKAIRNEISRTDKLPDGMVKVASIPMVLYMDLKQRGILGDKAALRKWLATDEAAPYRTHWMTS
jgi:hypothetical protein